VATAYFCVVPGDKIQKKNIMGRTAFVGKIRNPYKILVGKTERKKQFGRAGQG
jgi:hypothetical protein